jgi:hypothetical protein
MRDVAGPPEDILYSFIGSPDLMTESEIDSILVPYVVDFGVNL